MTLLQVAVAAEVVEAVVAAPVAAAGSVAAERDLGVAALAPAQVGHHRLVRPPGRVVLRAVE